MDTVPSEPTGRRPGGAALPDWTGQWDDIGDRPTRLAYLREYWPDLVGAIEAEARADAPDVEALTRALEATGALWSANDYYEVTTDAHAFAEAIAREYRAIHAKRQP
jgi:hypothetical protein